MFSLSSSSTFASLCSPSFSSTFLLVPLLFHVLHLDFHRHRHISTMAKLLDLPTELLLLILSHFDHFMYKYELQSLCISSKRLYSIAQPLLYRDFVREVNCQCCHKIGTPPGRIIPLVLFTRTLISRPDLASCVRSAAFDNSENVFDDEDVCEVEFGADTFKVLATGFQ